MLALTIYVSPSAVHKAGVLQHRIDLLSRDLLRLTVDDQVLEGSEPAFLGECAGHTLVLVEGVEQMGRQLRLGGGVLYDGAVRVVLGLRGYLLLVDERLGLRGRWLDGERRLMLGEELR